MLCADVVKEIRRWLPQPLVWMNNKPRAAKYPTMLLLVAKVGHLDLVKRIESHQLMYWMRDRDWDNLSNSLVTLPS